MESRRRQKRDSNRRPQDRKPPRCNWQPTVPLWEKSFCKVVGSMDWENFLEMKRFIPIYEKVMKWDDSAVEEAFCNAKNRFWAEINDLPCDISLPDPELYIDKIDWDSEINPEVLADLESQPMISSAGEDHDPVVIFGDALLPTQQYCVGEGWGEDGWGSCGWGADEQNNNIPANPSFVNHVDKWEQNWGDPFDNRAAMGWPVYTNNAWHFSDGSGAPGYMMWGGGWSNDSGWNNHSGWNDNTCWNNDWGWNNNKGWNNESGWDDGSGWNNPNTGWNDGSDWNNPNLDWNNGSGWNNDSGWNYTNNNINYEVGPNDQYKQGPWHGSKAAMVDAGGHVPSYRTSKVRRNDSYRKYVPKNDREGHNKATGWNSRKWNSFNSCGPVSHQAGMSAGQSWNQEKPVS